MNKEVVMDRVAGLEFADPYHWLEDDNDPSVQQWQKNQNQIASAYIKEWPHSDALQQSVDHFMVGQPTLPIFAGGRWFRIEGKRVVMASTPLGEGVIIFNLQQNEGDDQTTVAFLSWMSPSPNGQLLAVGVCDDGSEHNTIRLINIATQTLLPNPPELILMDNWTGGVSWLPDNSGFYFVAFEGEPNRSEERVYFYSMSDATPIVQNIPLPYSGTVNYIIVTVSESGRYHLVHQNDMEPRPVAVLDTARPNPEWRPFITIEAGAVVGHTVDDSCYAITTVNSPRGRIVKIPLDSSTPNDPKSWTELVPESHAVMRSMTRVGSYFYLHEFVDTYSRVRIIDLSGNCVGTVPLPEKAALLEGHYPIQHLIPKGHTDEFLFSYSTFLQSWGIYRHKPGDIEISTAIETLSAPEVCIENGLIEDCWATSADGTQVPYHCVRLASTDASTPQPTLMYAYGAFGVPWTPAYPGSMAAFITAGGVYVHGHIRGGGELGSDWWHKGRLEDKQKGYQDLYAIAEQLISNGQTTTQQLALTGRSNGGLMAGVAITQRPELWRAVVPQVPLFDLIGALRDPYTRQVIKGEFADPENAEQVARMVDYSPYHLIQEKNYPAVYITAGATDPRCAAWQARKFAARLQDEKNGIHPVLVHIWENAGHGQATARAIAVEQYSEWMAFLMRELSLVPKKVTATLTGNQQ